jgi:hypothetical protein
MARLSGRNGSLARPAFEAATDERRQIKLPFICFAAEDATQESAFYRLNLSSCGVSSATPLTEPTNSRMVGNSYLIGIMVSIPHAHASCDSAVTCPYIGQKDLTAVVFKALFHVQTVSMRHAWLMPRVKTEACFRSIFNVCSPILCVLGNPLDVCSLRDPPMRGTMNA